jgi:hypothetical protein
MLGRKGFGGSRKKRHTRFVQHRRPFSCRARVPCATPFTSECTLILCFHGTISVCFAGRPSCGADCVCRSRFFYLNGILFGVPLQNAWQIGRRREGRGQRLHESQNLASWRLKLHATPGLAQTQSRLGSLNLLGVLVGVLEGGHPLCACQPFFFSGTVLAMSLGARNVIEHLFSTLAPLKSAGLRHCLPGPETLVVVVGRLALSYLAIAC